MLRALRRRLALLLALLSALVLTLVAAAGLWLAWQQQTRASDLVFRSRFAALCDQLAVADLVTDGWLAARQLELGGVLDLVDGGRPVHFSVRQRQDADLAALLDQAEVEDANLDCYIHFVRRRLRAVGSAARVVTVRGSGYRLEVPPC